MKFNKLAKLFTIALVSGTLLTACPESTPTSAKTDNSAVNDSSEQIGAAQPLPILTYSMQRQIMTEALINMAVPNRPYYMIATNDGVGYNAEIPIIAYAVVKGCVPATFQLTNPEKIADSHTNGGYIALPRPELNSMFTGDTAATYCIGYDGTFFSIEHKTSFSTKPFSEAIRSKAQVDFTPNLITDANGSIIDRSSNTVLYQESDNPVQINPGVTLDLKTNQIVIDSSKAPTIDVEE